MAHAQPRFTKVLREYKRRNGECDRYWCVVDRNQHKFLALKVNASYPGAELLAGAYALKLNATVENRTRVLHIVQGIGRLSDLGSVGCEQYADMLMELLEAPQ